MQAVHLFGGYFTKRNPSSRDLSPTNLLDGVIKNGPKKNRSHATTENTRNKKKKKKETKRN